MWATKGDGGSSPSLTKRGDFPLNISLMRGKRRTLVLRGEEKRYKQLTMSKNLLKDKVKHAEMV